MDQSTRNDFRFSIVSQDGDEIFIRTKRSAPFMKVLKRYCTKKQLEYNTIVFLYNGNRVTGRKTPEMLRMRNDDQIDAFIHQDGGGTKEF